MRKLIYVILTVNLLFLSMYANAQTGEWAWIHGDSALNGTVNYGTQGVPSPTNEPPSIYEPCEWTDLNGNFWMFGGLDNNSKVYCDLWKFDISINQWTWMRGTGVSYDPGSYGVQGVPSPSNYPGGRSFGLPTWVDLQGNLWMYGGVGALSYNDLWEYNISTNEWTWMQGPNTDNNPPVYGTKNVADSSNTPGYRSECAAAWTDNAGDLWLFGGFNDNMFNDLWRFNIASNQWTWMNGSQIQGSGGIYGTKGTEGTSNTPGARAAYSHWKDNTGKLWFFGGWNINTGNYYNDLWRYNTANNKWAWMGGSNAPNGIGIYGTECASSSGNIPDARGENRAVATDQNGNFWMFGGVGQSNTENDLWQYCVTANEWTWVSGNTNADTGSWGTLGLAAPSNKPSGRCGAVGWSDHNGHLYFYGGSSSQGPGYYNDLWEFTVDPTCGVCAVVVAAPVASFQSNDTSLCAGDCINFTNKSTNNPASWKWAFTGGSPSSSTLKNPQNICYLASGNYNVKLVVSNSSGSDSLTFSNYIKVAATPPTPTITQHGDSLFCSTDSSYTSYQWYNDTTLIPGANTNQLVVNSSGDYNIQVSNETGCKIAVGINIVLGIKPLTANVLQLNIYPNPASSGELFVTGYPPIGKITIKIYNAFGEALLQAEIKSGESEINISSLSAGIYFVEIQNDYGRWNGRFLKE